MSSEKKIDPRTRRTRRLLQSALLELLRTRPLNQIHIKEIAAKAEISRQAFYLNFETKDEILFSYFDDAFAGLQQKAYATSGLKENFDLKILLTEAFQAYQENIETVRWVMQVENKDLLIIRLREQISGLMEIYRSSQPMSNQKAGLDPYVLDYVSGGIYMLLRRWLNEGMKKTKEEMGAIAYELMNSL